LLLAPLTILKTAKALWHYARREFYKEHNIKIQN
jgi:hypothetical protein